MQLHLECHLDDLDPEIAHTTVADPGGFVQVQTNPPFFQVVNLYCYTTSPLLSQCSRWKPSIRLTVAVNGSRVFLLVLKNYPFSELKIVFVVL